MQKHTIAYHSLSDISDVVIASSPGQLAFVPAPLVKTLQRKSGEDKHVTTTITHANQ